MNPEIKAEWTRRLRSGEVRQAKSTLRRQYPDGSVGYCCLGVLCEMAVEAGVAERSDSATSMTSLYRGAGGDRFGSVAALPVDVMKWAGLKAADPVVSHETGQSNLSVLNDSGKSFDSIAYLIDQSL
jgi:hypothetical protein